jgi:hemerythrin-like domain-containing protein
MRATEILKEEHRAIEKVVDCLEIMGKRCLERKRLDQAAARLALDFFQHFADGCHHAKEEESLFPLLEARGFSRATGPTGVMFSEHELGRKHLRAMNSALEKPHEDESLRRFAHHAQAYVQLLREHIFKEDHVLFQMADRIFNDADQEKLSQEFFRLEQNKKPGEHEKYLQMANNLAEMYQLAPLASPEHHCSGCAHHASMH